MCQPSRYLPTLVQAPPDKAHTFPQLYHRIASLFLESVVPIIRDRLLAPATRADSISATRGSDGAELGIESEGEYDGLRACATGSSPKTTPKMVLGGGGLLQPAALSQALAPFVVVMWGGRVG